MVDEVESRIVAHLPYARAVASRAIDPRCRGADREDLISWGIVGLVHAGRKMQPLSVKGRRRVAGLTLEPSGAAKHSSRVPALKEPQRAYRLLPEATRHSHLTARPLVLRQALGPEHRSEDQTRGNEKRDRCVG